VIDWWIVWTVSCACVTAVWAFRDESGNYSQKHDAEIIKEEKRIEVENEVRLQVDELMREELKNLKMVRRIGYNSP